MEYGSARADINYHEAVVSLSSPHSGPRPGQRRERNTFQLSVGCISSRLHTGLLGDFWALSRTVIWVQGRAEDLRMPGKEWGEHPHSGQETVRKSSAGLGNMVSGETTKASGPTE